MRIRHVMNTWRSEICSAGARPCQLIRHSPEDRKSRAATTFSRTPMSRIRPSLPLWLLFLVAAASCCNALHFYLDSNEKRCFLEEIPADTVVEGILSLRPRNSPVLTRCIHLLGHYKALEWNEKEAKYSENPQLGILVEVDVCTRPRQ